MKTEELGALHLSADPYENFRRWLDEAEKALALEEATAMTLATASRAGLPSARIVLYKGLGKSATGETGFRLFTNYESGKSHDLAENGHAALVFHWPRFRRQIRIAGRVERLPAAESDAYFARRARPSQIAAWASPQSHKIDSRAELLERVRNFELKFKNNEVARPPNWGGWLLIPATIEFWQAGEHRLHDRFLFERETIGWSVSRLAP